jgi:hypothetical protein
MRIVRPSARGLPWIAPLERDWDLFSIALHGVAMPKATMQGSKAAPNDRDERASLGVMQDATSRSHGLPATSKCTIEPAQHVRVKAAMRSDIATFLI